MAQPIRTYFLPALMRPHELAGGTAVVADILRATTCIVQALAHGANEIFPVLEVAEARALAAGIPNCLLVGERQGQRIEGFDLGNSPSEFGSSVVAGRSLVMTTTNGTRALHACQSADRVWIGAFLNLTSLLEQLQQTTQPLHLICAGTDGQITREDVLFTGALVSRLRERDASRWLPDDASRIAETAWHAAHPATPTDLAREFQQTLGGANLVSLGFASDLLAAAHWDSAPIVPYLDTSLWRITRPLDSESERCAVR